MGFTSSRVSTQAMSNPSRRPVVCMVFANLTGQAALPTDC
jgi:hypothetical protein